MEKVLMILSQEFGLQTVIKAVVVCVVMMIVKKIKPNLSPKVEVIVRLALSVLVHLLFTVITKGEFLSIAEDVMSICGVSMIFSAIISKNYNVDKMKSTISTYLPNFDVDKIDEYKQHADQEEVVTSELIEEEKDQRISMGN